MNNKDYVRYSIELKVQLTNREYNDEFVGKQLKQSR